MRIAIISDIHGNSAALRAVLADLAHQEVDDVLVGGDLALGGREPGAALDLLMARGWPGVAGNTDHFLLRLASGGARADEDPFGDLAEWTLAQMTPSHLEYLRALPDELRRALPAAGDLLLVHATPWSVEEVVLPDAPDTVARRMLTEGRAHVVAYGHIHSPYQRRLAEGLLFSVGAVIASNDQDPRPAYAILTDGPRPQVEVRRVSYDVNAEMEAMVRDGVPVSLDRREWLKRGGPWPVRAAL